MPKLSKERRKAMEIETIAAHLTAAFSITAECVVCASSTSDDVHATSDTEARRKYAFDCYDSGWRILDQPHLQLVGLTCPDCIANPE